MRSWWRSPGRGRSHGALHAIPGIGRKRAERYGKDLLAITARRRRRRKASSDAEAPMRTLPSELPVFTRYYDLFEWGEALQNAGAAP